MPSSAKSSFISKRLRMAAQEQAVCARTALSINMEPSSPSSFSRPTSRFVHVESNGAYYFQKSILKPTNSPSGKLQKRVSFTSDPAHGMSSSNSLVSAPSEDPCCVHDGAVIRAEMQKSPQPISGVMPSPKATTKTDHLSVQIGIGFRHGHTLNDYTYYFPAPTAVTRLGQPSAEEFSALYCSLWQRDGHCPCFSCARHRRTLRQTPKLGRRGSLPRLPRAVPPADTSFCGFVDRTNVTVTDILIAAGVYTPVSELNYGTQVFEFKERQQRLRIRQAKTLQKASDNYNEKKNQLNETILDGDASTSIKSKKRPTQTKSTTTPSYQAWCNGLFQDPNEDEDAVALTDASMTPIESDIIINNNHNNVVDPEIQHEWDEVECSLLRLHYDRTTMRKQAVLTTCQRSQQRDTIRTAAITQNDTAEKKQKQRILNPLTHIRLFQAQLKLDREHKQALAKLHREHLEQEKELFNEYPDLEPRFYELVGIKGKSTPTESSQWWLNWLEDIQNL